MQKMFLALLCAAALPLACAEDEIDRLPAGPQPDGRIVVPTNQILNPAGKQALFPGRPVDLALDDDGRTLVVKNMKNLVFIETATGKVQQTLAAEKIGFSVTGLLVEDGKVYVTDSNSNLRTAQKNAEGAYAWQDSIPLVAPGKRCAAPAGFAFMAPGVLCVASSCGNCVQFIDLAEKKILEIVPVGVAPYAVVAAGKTLFVSNWGGDPPREGEPQLKSAGTPIRVDPKTGIANDGSVSVLEQLDGKWRTSASIKVGLHPSGMARNTAGTLLYVANANSDTVSVIDIPSRAVVETIFCRPQDRLPFGSGANAVALSPDQKTLYVANGTNNCVAVVALGKAASGGLAEAEKSCLLGLIPTGWYPGALKVSADGRTLFVANVKGIGSLAKMLVDKDAPRNTHQHLGSVSLIELPNAEELARHTAEVQRNNRLACSLAGLDLPRPDAEPLPLPQRHGEPSIFKHVIYVIKENRTYDQVFGDIKEGNGDPKLVMFGEEVTPNQHALARQFTLFDNFYCSGVLSADGHSWVNQAYVTDYLEKAFADFVRSYPYEGNDPLAFAPVGFLWDNALAHGRTIYNFGEFTCTHAEPDKVAWKDLYADYVEKTNRVKMTITTNSPSLAPFTHPEYPGFWLQCPDVSRAAIFIKELKRYEETGQFPNLVYVYLPNNHTCGINPSFPTPKAMVADNDLALGRVVEAVTRSKFWPETCIFVVEDDPQNGFDHVDGHRTVALCISPYTKRAFVDHTSYNQTGMVKTIELLLGLPPLNQMDLSATPMCNCFQIKPDLTPYACLENEIPLDQMNPNLKKQKGAALKWAKKSGELALDEADKADEDTFNRILWFATHGKERYPIEFVSAEADDERLPEDD